MTHANHSFYSLFRFIYFFVCQLKVKQVMNAPRPVESEKARFGGGDEGGGGKENLSPLTEQVDGRILEKGLFFKRNEKRTD